MFKKLIVLILTLSLFSLHNLRESNLENEIDSTDSSDGYSNFKSWDRSKSHEHKASRHPKPNHPIDNSGREHQTSRNHKSHHSRSHWNLPWTRHRHHHFPIGKVILISSIVIVLIILIVAAIIRKRKLNKIALEKQQKESSESVYENINTETQPSIPSKNENLTIEKLEKNERNHLHEKLIGNDFEPTLKYNTGDVVDINRLSF